MACRRQIRPTLSSPRPCDCQRQSSYTVLDEPNVQSCLRPTTGAAPSDRGSRTSRAHGRTYRYTLDCAGPGVDFEIHLVDSECTDPLN